MKKMIRILIVDDHPVVRAGLKALISTEDGMEVVGEASTGDEGVEKAKALNPDVMLLDLVMPGKDGIETLHELQKINSDTRVLVLTSFGEEQKVFPAIKAGALGYLLKDSSPEELLKAIRQVYRRDASLHPAIARKVIAEISRQSNRPPTKDPLTEREITVLKLVSQGLSNRKIGGNLYISERTVRSHVGNILNKLHLANRTQAALYALKEGMIDLK